MKNISTLVICAIISLTFERSTSAQVPQIINYQGRISVGGTNYTGTGQFQFALVSATGATTFWSNGVNAVSLPVTNGFYAVLLGDTGLANMTYAVPATVFTNSDVRLRVWFGTTAPGIQQLAPDQRIAAAGYALNAAQAQIAVTILPTSDVTGQRLNIGTGHTLSGTSATIAGGENNTASAYLATIGGGSGNSASVEGATVGGGYGNTASNDYATVGGGYGNTASNDYATVGGGLGNTAGGDRATVGGGSGNTASGTAAAVGGGGWNGLISGGNTASGVAATVGGGSDNTASGEKATVPGGRANVAGGAVSFAAGYRAKAIHDGAFVWTDATEADFVSTAANQFLVRATGGVGIGTNSASAQLTVASTGGFSAPQLAVIQNAPADYARLRFGVSGSSMWDLSVGSGATPVLAFYANGGDRMTIDTTGDVTARIFTPTSDRNQKEGFDSVDPRDVLQKVAALPVGTWNFIADRGTRHIGPVAQDFHAAFNVGADDKHIATVDADGVALAAIQGLYQELTEERAKRQAASDELAELRRELRELKAEIRRVAATRPFLETASAETTTGDER